MAAPEIDQGPCSNLDADGHLTSCQSIFSELQRIRNVSDVAKADKSLLWLSNSQDFDCTRLLLRAKEILWDNHLPFYQEYPLYWKTCGNLLAEIASRQRRLPTLAGVSAIEILQSIRTRFYELSEDPWTSRRYLIDCLKEFGKRCQADISWPGEGAFCEFWKTAEVFLGHLQAAVGTYITGEVAVPVGVRSAVSAYFSFWSETTLGLIGYAKERNRLISRQARLIIVKMAMPLFQASVLSDPTISSKTRDDWQKTWDALLEHLRGMSRVEDLKRCFGEIATEINEGYRQMQPVVQHELSALRSHLMPTLHGRDPATNRRAPLPEYRECAARFFGKDTLRDGILRAVILRDICPASYRGFRVDCRELAVEKTFEKQEGFQGQYVDGLYSCREIRVVWEHGYLRLDYVRLSVTGVQKGRTFQIDFPCKIMRAWPLLGGGCGLALRADASEMGGVPECWVEYVETCPVCATR